MNKYLYKIKDLEVPPWLKYWFARKSKVNFDLSQILNGTSFDLTNTVNKKLHLINIFGNSVQNGEPTPENPLEVKSSGDNGNIVEKFSNSDNTQLQIYTIPCQQPMRAIGNVKDTFVKVNGVWYERHNIKELNLKNVDIRVPDKNDENIVFCNLANTSICDFKTDNQLFICDYFNYKGELTIGGYSQALSQGVGMYSRYNNGAKYLYFVIPKTIASNVEEVNTWITNTSVKVYYNSNEPLNLPCTQAQITALEALMKAKTYKDVTHIYTDDEVPAELQIQYYKEKGE